MPTRAADLLGQGYTHNELARSARRPRSRAPPRPPARRSGWARGAVRGENSFFLRPAHRALIPYSVSHAGITS